MVVDGGCSLVGRGLSVELWQGVVFGSWFGAVERDREMVVSI